MAEITFKVIPKPDDISINGILLNDIDAFRTDCLMNSEVVCGWDTLHTNLIDHRVSKIWWFLTESERRSIAEVAIKNTMFYDIMLRGTGLPNCEGADETTFKHCPCGAEAIIRYLKFASTKNSTVDSCYWKRALDYEAECFKPTNSYLLPCHYVSYEPEDSIGHFMCSIHVKEGVESIDNWVIFQCETCDIKVGDSQMLPGAKVVMNLPTSIACSLVGCGTPIAEFFV